MTRALALGSSSRDLGPDHVVEALFTTIGCRLEPGGRGTRFPAVMDDLWSGYLKPDRAPQAQQELQEIEEALRKIPVSDVVWNLSSLRRGEDAAEPVNHRAGNVFEYFVDPEGRQLITRLRESVQECRNSAQVLRLVSPGAARQMLFFGLFVTVLGAAWLYLGRTLIPEWNLRRLTASLPVWTFGMDIVMCGIAIMIAAAFPGVNDWFRRRPWALATMAITAVLGWLVICDRAGFLPD